MVWRGNARPGPHNANPVTRISRFLVVALLAIPATAALPNAHAAGTGARHSHGANTSATARVHKSGAVKAHAFVSDGITDYVNGATGTDTPGCGSLASPCKTIQYTIDNIADNGDTISIAAGTYNELVFIDFDLALVGAGAATTLISGTGLAGSVVTVTDEASASLTGLTIENGTGTPDNGARAGVGSGNVEGGGIYVETDSTLTVTNSVITHNTTSSTVLLAEGVGGGIFSDGTLTVSSSTVSNNTVSGPASDVSEFVNSGGGIFNGADGTLTVDESTISGNTVTGPSDNGAISGGIDNLGLGTMMMITGSTINGNTVTATGDATAFGGGIVNGGDSSATIANSTITGNTAIGTNGANADGGGINNFFRTAHLVLTNDTITGNSAATDTGTATGGGIELPNEMGNTILASNSVIKGGTPVSADCGSAVVTDDGGNVADDATCGFTAGSSVTSSATLAASIAALANNGGETMTQALLPGSPAIGAGLAAICAATPISGLDQRGLPRYEAQRGACDSGAYDTGGGIVPPLTVAGAIPLTTGGATRLGFAASNHGSFTGVTLPGFPIGYITFQRGISTFVVRQPVAVACTSATLGLDHCAGTTGVVQGVTQFVPVPGTATVTLTGTISSRQGPAYPLGATVVVTLTITTSATGAVTVASVTVTVNGTTAATWTAPLPNRTNIQISDTSPLIP